MAVTLEQVERLKEKVDVSYEEAKAALEQADGDLLEALIALERQGRTKSGTKGGGSDGAFFTTRPGGSEGGTTAPVPVALYTKGGKEKKHKAAGGASGSRGFWAQARQLLEAGLNILRHCTINQFEVWRNGEMTTSVPVLILIILVIVAPWVSIPLLVVGLFFDCKYRFTGPDLNKEKVNEVMETVSATVNGVVDSVKDEFHKATEKKEK